MCQIIKFLHCYKVCAVYVICIWAKSVFGSLLRRSIKKRRKNYDEKNWKMHGNYVLLLKIIYFLIVQKYNDLLHDFTNFLFIICRWGKERPLNTRLLIQNVGLPTHDIDCVPGLEGNEGTSSDKLGSNEEAPWEVQVFRSITSDSARYMYKVLPSGFWGF